MSVAVTMITPVVVGVIVNVPPVSSVFNVVEAVKFPSETVKVKVIACATS